MNEIDEKFIGILKARYEECDSSGHRALNHELNRCDYCYRILRQETMQERVLRAMKKGPYMIPFDAIAFANRKPQEFLQGIELLRQELDSGKLEKVAG